MLKIPGLMSLCMLLCILGFGQAKTVTGKVTNQKGDPIPYASVKVKGKSTGVSADVNGNYSIAVSAGDILIISSTGITDREMKVGDSNLLDISVNAGDLVLSEVIVTALGVSRQKKALGYAVQNIDALQLTEAANPNLATAIQGKVSGVEVRPSSGMPGASAQIFIRGARFFDGDNSPLYVIDGLPVNSQPDIKVGANGIDEENSFGVENADFSGRSIDINPNDIESISVLKGQAASALYGMRASNGVIMITTKNGRRLQKGAPVIAFSTNWQLDNVSRFPDLQQKYAQGNFGAFVPNSANSWGPLIAELPNDPSYGGNVPNAFNGNNPTDETKGKYWNPKKNEWVIPQVYENVRDFFKTGLTVANNISISQAGDMGSYYIGLGGTDQAGIMVGSKMKRYNARFSGEFNVSPKVKAGINANYSTVALNKMSGGSNSLLFEVYGAPPSYDLKGTPISVEGDPYKQIQYRSGEFDNPYWGVKYNKFLEDTRRFLGNTYFSYNPLKSLNIKWQVGMDQYTTDREELYEFGAGKADSGKIRNAAFINRTFNSQLTATFNKQINNDWHINALAGNEFNDNYTRSVVADGVSFLIPGWNNIRNTNRQTNGEVKFKERSVGFYAQAGLDWKDMLYLSVTGRNDYVSTMPRGSRSFFYPSASLSWVFTELNAFKGNNFYGKLRASVAQVGAAGKYKESYYIYHISSSGFLQSNVTLPLNGVAGLRPNSTLYDPNLKPQNTHSFEIGTELSFFNNRIGIDYTYVRQTTKDQIFLVPFAGSTGFGEIVRNAGEMQSNVHEVTLRITPVKSSSFQWDVTTNFTKISNKVISLADGVDNILLGGFTNPQIRAAIGYTYPTIYGTTFLRNEKGQMRLDEDGTPLTGTDGVIGNVSPDFLLDVSNGIKYKSFRLNVLLAWKKGGQMYSGANRLIKQYGTSGITANRETDVLLLQGVKESTVVDDKGGDPNDVAIEGAAAFQNYYSVTSSIAEAHVYGTSFVKLREIALSLDIPRAFLQKSRFIKSASFTISARNILLWTELPNFDPESSQGNGNMQSGFEYMSLPQARSVGVGLNLTF